MTTPRPPLTTTQRRMVYAVTGGAALLATIGFVGSYAAVRELAEQKHFGKFARVFPIGIDAGIGVLLGLDLLLTWLRIPFPLLRPAAWVLTVATIAFNAATAWPDPLGVSMHAVIPLLFVVVVEAARHAVGRVADITADRHIEPVRLWRWLLSPVPTFRLWRRMKLWELRSYPQVLRLEQDRLVYRAGLEMQHGRNWRRKASAAELLPLRLSRIGLPLESATPSFDRVADEAVAIAADAPARPDLPAATPPPDEVQHPVAPPAITPAAPAATAPKGLVDPVQLLTVADVATLRGVAQGTVRSWVNRGKLVPVPRDGNAPNRFHPDAVAALDAAPATPSHDPGIGQGGEGYN